MSDTKLTGFYHPWPNLGVKLSRQWEKLRDNTEKEAPLIRAAYVDAQPSSANDPGNHDLSGWAIGERDFRNRFRIWYDKTNDRFSIQYNSGTEAVEVWDDYLSIRQVDGRVTVHGYGGLDSAAGGFYTTVPRNLAISRTFTPAAREWVFDHNLDTKPILWNAFNLEDKSVTPTTVDVSNPNIAYFYFPALQAGRAIVVAEQARGEGIRITDGVNVFPAANRLIFNRHDFYLSNEGHGAPVVNLQPIDFSGTQHGNLGALTADDHPQYARTDGTRTITGDQRFASDIVVEDKATAGSFYSPTFGEVAYANQGYLSVTQTNGSPLFSTVNSLKFEHQNFYLTADSDGKPIVNFRGVGGGSGGGQFGTGLESESFSSSTQWAFNHGLGTANVIWSVYDNQGYAVIPDKVSTHDPNIAYFYFSPATAGKVVIAGGPLVNTITVKGNTGAAWNRSTDTLNFNPAHFYITATATGKPIINAQPSAGGGVTDHGALTGLLDDDHSQYLLASQATDRSTFTTNWADLTDGGATTLHSHADTSGGFYAKMASGAEFGDTVVFADTDFNKSGQTLTVDETGLDHSQLANLTSGDPHTQYVLKTEASPGFYGVNFRETDGNPPAFRNDTLIFDSEYFYLQGDSTGKPTVSLRPTAGGGAGVSDHGALTGLSDDDHPQYLLASDATNRATFAANWTDLTDGGPTTLHSHAAGASDHGALTGLLDDDHSQYSLASGSRAFTGTVGGISPTAAAHLATKGYVDIRFSNFYNDLGGVSDHGALTGLTDDDHSQYILADGTRAFTGPVTLPSGSVGSPALNIGEAGTGVYLPASGNLDLALTGGFIGARVTAFGLQTPDGTASNPSHTFINDTDTGLFLKGANVLGISARGVEQGYLDENGLRIHNEIRAANFYLTSGGELVNDHGALTGLADNDHPQYLLRTEASPGFYGVNFRETDGGPDFKNDTIYFNSSSFYLTSNSLGKPIVNFRGSAGTGTALTVKDIDGNPTVSNVSTIQFTNGSVTDQGGGVAQVTLGGGSGISTLTEGSKSFGSQTTLGFNSRHFYLSPGGTAGSKVLNLRYSKEIIPVFQELVTVSNFAIDPFVPYPYTIETVDIDCKSGSCVAAFYILAANARNKNGKSIVGLDPIDVSTSVARKVATANNSVNPGDCLMLSIPSNTTAKHLRISITAKKPN